MKKRLAANAGASAIGAQRRNPRALSARAAGTACAAIPTATRNAGASAVVRLPYFALFNAAFSPIATTLVTPWNATMHNIYFTFFELSSTQTALKNTFILGTMAATFGTVRFRTFFAPGTDGAFVMHCHMIQHEDIGMMQRVELLPRP